MGNTPALTLRTFVAAAAGGEWQIKLDAHLRSIFEMRVQSLAKRTRATPDTTRLSEAISIMEGYQNMLVGQIRFLQILDDDLFWSQMTSYGSNCTSSGIDLPYHFALDSFMTACYFGHRAPH